MGGCIDEFQQLGIFFGRRVAIAPFEAQVRFIPDDNMIDLALEMGDKCADELCVILKVIGRHITLGTILFNAIRVHPIWCRAENRPQSRDDGQPFVSRHFNNAIRVVPVILIFAHFHVRPRKKIDNGACSHFTHELQRSLDFDVLYLIG